MTKPRDSRLDCDLCSLNSGLSVSVNRPWLIINQLAQCNYCKKGIDLKSKQLLSELFKLKIEQACQIKKAS